MNNILKKINTKYLHIAIIILGSIFVVLSIFHSNLWFDESYSVAIAKHSFSDIWKIGSNDVHPILYYFGLHLLNLIFGNNLIIYRIFSAIPIIILGILGYTHIKKDFGKNIGFLFSFFTFFLPISCVYAGEIRMYTWSMLFVSLMSIYAYRIYINASENEEKINKIKIKNWALFAIFSLSSCYSHYYGLVTAGIINLILFIYLIIKSLKNHKKNKDNKLYTADLKCFTVSAVTQVLLYLPWLIFAFSQLNRVSKGFWIQKPGLEAALQIFIFQFTGDLDCTLVSKSLSIAFSIFMLLYAIYTVVRAVRKGKLSFNKPGLWAIGIYLLVTLAIYIISVIKVPILFARYFLNLTGLFIFFLAFFVSKGGRRILNMIVCIITIIMAGIINYQVIKMNYDEGNNKPLAYIEESIKETDMLLWENNSQGFAISTILDKYPKCFYDKLYWNQEAAYEAFGKDMITIKKIDELSEYQGRIWIISPGNYTVYNEMLETYKNKIVLIKQKAFETTYHQNKYTITLIEKIK